MEFKLAMSLKELKKRTSKSCYRPVKFLKLDSREVKKLSKADFLVLMHLTRAAVKFDEINLKLDNHHNLEFAKFLEDEIKKGNKKAVLAQKMFKSQKSMFSPDSLGNQTELAVGVPNPDGLGYFPEDLDAVEFHKILNEMLDNGETEEVQKILSQRTIVVRDENKLKAIDFVDAFPEFREIAKELREAKKHCDDKTFCEYLELQAKALETADPMLDAEADKVWATLDKCKFEFTISRECYAEKLTKTIFENKKLKDRLEKVNITIYAKDSLGARVGIVNKNGTKLLKKLRELINISAKFMPYQDEYKPEKKAEGDKIPQTAVDVDLITLTGDEGAYRASLVLAQNLPNDDKPSLAIGGGRRNVYHRQVRLGANKKLFKNLISENDFKYFNPDADHWAVICHENTHSLGPKSYTLGKYSSILEEYKADMGMYAFLDEFVEASAFSEEQTKQIMVTSLSYSFLKGKPSLDQAHRVRSVMICNRMLSTGSIKLTDGKLEFDFEKIKKTTKQMMSEVVRLQLDKNVDNAKKYIDKWFVWTDEIDAVAKTMRKLSKKLNGYLETPLADMMVSADFEDRLNLMFSK